MLTNICYRWTVTLILNQHRATYKDTLKLASWLSTISTQLPWMLQGPKWIARWWSNSTPRPRKTLIKEAIWTKVPYFQTTCNINLKTNIWIPLTTVATQLWRWISPLTRTKSITSKTCSITAWSTSTDPWICIKCLPSHRTRAINNHHPIWE